MLWRDLNRALAFGWHDPLPRLTVERWFVSKKKNVWTRRGRETRTFSSERFQLQSRILHLESWVENWGQFLKTNHAPLLHLRTVYMNSAFVSCDLQQKYLGLILHDTKPRFM
jgi:hypothetical protein